MGPKHAHAAVAAAQSTVVVAEGDWGKQHADMWYVFCRCGWMSEHHWTRREAQDEYRQHKATVTGA